MKTFPLAVLAALLVAAASPAQNRPASAPGTSASSPAAAGQRPAGELAALEQFLNLSDAELAEMEQAIARLRRMTPAERAALREQVVAFCRMPETQRMQVRQGWGWMPPEIQATWREMMQSSTPARHAEIQAKMQSLPPAERADYRRELVDAYLKKKDAKK
jgi:hypothetical protein